MKKRFIVVDPSFTSHDGDRWQYSVSLARSAKEAGYDFILLTNVMAPRVRRAAGFGIEERRVFPHTFYQHDQVYERHRRAIGGGWRRTASLKQRQRLNKLESRLARLRSTRDWMATRGNSISVADLERRIRRIDGRLKRERDRKHLPQRAAEFFGLSGEKRVRPFNRDDFAIALANELTRLAPGPDDILFFHTMTYGMMESLSEVTARLEHSSLFDTNAYFLFHFGIEAPDAKTFVDRYYSYSAYGSIADRMKVGAPFSRLYFLATSEVLREEAEQILGAPVSIWHGLVDLDHLHDSLGGALEIRKRRDIAIANLARGEVRLVVRAADMNPDNARAISRACHLVQHRGNVVRLRILFHGGSLPRLREILAQIDFPNVELIDTVKNEDYIAEICDAGLVLLTYDREKYKKRVSAVLHDCSVLGVPVIVPSGTTLPDSDYATKFVYGSNDNLLGALLYAVRYLQHLPEMPRLRTSRARQILTGNAIERLLTSAPVPSLTRASLAPVANVIMPLWGRVGSSYAMEAQIRYLIGRGYFVNQIFLMDKCVKPLDAIEYFWKMLRENSKYARGSIQRVAFWDEAHDEKGRFTSAYAKAGAFGQFLARIARNSCEDPLFEQQVRTAELTVVNHVFHSQWAFKHAGGKKILETHDIQSYQMAAWPLINEAKGKPDGLPDLLELELKTVRKFDHVVNVSREEHLILSTANNKSSLVTPYLPVLQRQSRFNTVWEMAHAENLDDSLKTFGSFDLLLMGDSHVANRESAIWFVKEVFKPYLSPLGMHLAMVGRLSEVVHQEVGAVPFLFYLGFVDDLETIKALSKIAVLPDRRGTGISIKTLEAFASGMPFVGTSVAFRGLREHLPAALETYDEPRGLADAIIHAVGDPERLAAMSALARQCYDAVASKKRFDDAWDNILSTVMRTRPWTTQLDAIFGIVQKEIQRLVNRRHA